jgi:hypothetical protein
MLVSSRTIVLDDHFLESGSEIGYTLLQAIWCLLNQQKMIITNSGYISSMWILHNMMEFHVVLIQSSCTIVLRREEVMKKRPRITWRLHRTVSKNKTKKLAQYYSVLEGHECSFRGCSAVPPQGDSVLFFWTLCVCDLDLGRWLFVSLPEANIQRVRQMGRCSSDVTRSYPAGCNVEIHRVADQIVSGRWRSFGLAKVIPMVSVPLWKVPVALPRWRFCGCPAMIDLGQRMNPWLSKFIFLDSTNTHGYHTFLAILSAWTWQ